ncbi:autotransporter outer membrane beta-barrel domain-containing protein, partial [Roseibium algae]|uniref:autotransporter outer membrane beta-barrel domain-containing protein n=1 Tax=Roseibium algae TaxID=3123038 RepID=UPI0030EEDAA6
MNNGHGVIDVANPDRSTGSVIFGAAAGEKPVPAGVLDAREIVFGSGRGSVVFNHTDTDYVFDLDVTLAGSMEFYSGHTTLTGNYVRFVEVVQIYKTGTLTLNNSYLGPIWLHDGVVFDANEHLAAGGFTVNSGATLGGVGGGSSTITVHSGGKLAPGNSTGNSIGTFRADIVYFNDGSIFEVDVDASGKSDRLWIGTGTQISPGATLSIVAAEGGTYAPLTIYQVLLFPERSLDGKFGTVTDNLAFLDADLNYLDIDLELSLFRTTKSDNSLLSFSDLASTPNRSSVADAVEAAGAGTLHDAVQSMRVGDTEQGFQQLSGESHSTIHSAGLTSANISRSSLTHRVITATGGVGASSGDQVSMGFHGEGEVPMLEQLNAQMWGEAFGGWGKVDATATTASMESYGGGFLTGFDAEIIADWRTGLMAGYSRNQFHSSGNGF